MSVVIPVWDDYAGQRLEEALESIRSQGSPCRIVVVDNASRVRVSVPDGVELITATSRLKLGAARNLGMTAVATEYVIVWDADDVMLPGTLSFLVERISSDPALVAFGCAIVDGGTTRRHRWPRRWVARLLSHRRLVAMLHTIWSLYPTTGATIMRTAAVRASGGYSDADSGDDWALGVSLLFRGPVGWDERPGRLYHDTPNSIWARHSSLRHLIMHARTVRRRIRRDDGIPRWMRRMLPLVSGAQWFVLVLLHIRRRAARIDGV